ncbi:hypothetical protein [Bifidobacterium simiiventris]|uniref:hypothetical protein n=1 Tax=Bifidobacterium simiiventris TaxID=2834434 RepID=UPI001C597716|nr:hypothetical protein [Bifidobacterium simiiventris]MBW3078440.1 hypothetical protein [Bifidobacterium simiiventris]
MAESEDQRWRVDDIRDTSMQTRLIPLSDLEDEGFDLSDVSDKSPATPETEEPQGPAAPPQPLPPSFFPTNTGRMRPIIVARPATSSPAIAAPAATQPARAVHANTPRTAPFSSVTSRTASAAANTSDSLARTMRSDSADPVASAGTASSTDVAGSQEPSAVDQTPARAPRISYSLQYRALHPRD